ncbi:FtsX-like permease family protein [Candidatus Uhrbacteria bacterium]|nr:FtsX-like permease family protein [Candidatus Uhrbacteria bacterium]
MNRRDLFGTAVESLLRTKSRSTLTILGIVIGIGAVILMMSVGRGAEGLILSQVSDLGADLVFVEPSSGDPTSGPPDPFVAQSIDLDDEEAMERSGIFATVSPQLLTTLPVTHEDSTEFYQVVGTDHEDLDIFPADLLYGRFMEESEIDGYAKVAVLGLEVAQDLFGDQDPVGQKIKIKSQSYRVIGSFEELGSRFFQNLDTRVVIPVTTMQRDLVGVDHVSFITALATGDINEAKEELRYLMRDSNDIDNPEGDPNLDNFFVSSQEDATEIIGVVGSVLTILLSSIAAISLVVGGIGIMNIMLVSVTERTREIGLRKAVGATYKEILWQFLVESVLLTIIGGFMGIVMGVLTSVGIGLIMMNFILSDWTIVIPLNAIILAAAVSTVVGLVFGIYPARSAARLDPIEALRYE